MSLVPNANVCLICMKIVLDDDKGIQCEHYCDRWFHAACVNLSDSEYQNLAADNNNSWVCNRHDCVKLADHPLNKLINNFETVSARMEALLTKLGNVTAISNDISSIKDQLIQVNEKLSNFEPRICDSENRIKLLEEEVKCLKNAENHGPNSNIETVIEEFHDRERRSRNVIVYNVPESKSRTVSVRIQQDDALISKLTSSFGSSELDYAFKSYRIGRPNKDKHRPLKVVFKNTSTVADFCKNFNPADLKNLDSDLHDVSLSRDRTPTERKYLNELRDTLKARTEGGETDLTIKFVNGVPKIVVNASKN